MTKQYIVQDIWFKRQRVFRTIFTTMLMVIPVVPQVLAIINGYWPTELGAVIIAEAIAINGALTAVVALPAVNTWLTKFGLGSVPKDVAVTVE